MKIKRWWRHALTAAVTVLAVGATSNAQTLVEVGNVRQVDGNSSNLTFGDQYLFTTSPAYTDANGFKFGPAIPLADPTIMWLGGVYYITGTDDLGNFRIYKTSDFKTFSLHKTAFSDSTRIYPDRPDGTKCKVNRIGGGGMLYTNLQAPQLLYDAANSKVHLVFTAVGAVLKASPSNPLVYSDVITVPHPAAPATPVNPIFPWHSGWQGLLNTATGTNWAPIDPTVGDKWAFSDLVPTWVGNPFETGDDSQIQGIHDACIFETFDYISAFVTSVSATDFVNSVGGNFSVVSPFSYLNGGTNMYDGGAAIGKILPTTAFTTHTVNVPPLIKWSSTSNFYTNSARQTFPAKGFRHIKTDGTDWHANARSLGGSIFIDPKDSNQPWYIYDWYSLGADAPQPAVPAAPAAVPAPYWYYGHHIAAVRLASLTTPWLISTFETTAPYHWGRNTNMSPALASPVTASEWGTYDALGVPSPSDSSAIEGGTAFYDSDRDAYASLGSRNMWDSPAYSIHYRYGIGKANFRQMALTAWDSNAVEFTLLKSDNPTTAYGRSYGLGQIIHLQKANGDPVLEGGKRVAMLVFHAKMDGSNYRTVFFKKLTFLTPSTTSDPLFQTLDEFSGVLSSDPWRTQFPTSW